MLAVAVRGVRELLQIGIVPFVLFVHCCLMSLSCGVALTAEQFVLSSSTRSVCELFTNGSE